MLALLQVGAFLGIEIAERLAHGISPTDIFHQLTDHGLWLVIVIGVGAQVLTAWLGSAASRLIASAAPETACSRTGAPTRPGFLAPVILRLVAPPMMHANGCRAPPGPLLVPAT
jgi:hypothetical protein